MPCSESQEKCLKHFVQDLSVGEITSLISTVPSSFIIGKIFNRPEDKVPRFLTNLIVNIPLGIYTFYKGYYFSERYRKRNFCKYNSCKCNQEKLN